MAATSGTKNPGVTPKGPAADALAEVEIALRERPGIFEFFQAVRLLTRMFSDRSPVGKFAPPDGEAVRFSVNPALSFPPSQIHGMDWDSPVPRMIVNFMGLTGPMGTLPYAYSELILERQRNRDRTLAAFLDIFNHRAISLFYQAWEKYRFQVSYEREGTDRMSRYLMALVGLGTLGLQNRNTVSDPALLFYTGLLSLQPRSAVALGDLLEDYFGVPVDVEQFVGCWQELPVSEQSQFDDGDSFAEQLGVGVVAGDAIWDRQSRIRLKMGPMTEEQYLSMLPSGSAWKALGEITSFFCGKEVQIEVQLILKRDEVPKCTLGDDSPGGPRLGWITWMKSADQFDRAPGDTILLIT